MGIDVGDHIYRNHATTGNHLDINVTTKNWEDSTEESASS
jgi:hypothetical protein